jgi:hypothetical protein
MNLDLVRCHGTDGELNWRFQELSTVEMNDAIRRTDPLEVFLPCAVDILDLEFLGDEQPELPIYDIDSYMRSYRLLLLHNAAAVSL